ncbi:unnamed protein product, partial [Plutella xylostella]
SNRDIVTFSYSLISRAAVIQVVGHVLESPRPGSSPGRLLSVVFLHEEDIGNDVLVQFVQIGVVHVRLAEVVAGGGNGG